MSDFFISYAREDQAFVRRLYDALTREKRETWVDWQGIAPTAEWLQEIFSAMESTDTFVFVISPSSVASRVCRRELAHAVEQSKRLIPVVWRDAPDGSVPDTLARLNWIFLREEDDFEAGLRQLLSAFDTDLDWVREHTRLLVRANEWERKNRDDSLLLRGQDLLTAERWLAAGATQKELVPTPIQAHYVTASRRGASRRQRIMLAAVACAAVLSIALAIWAMAERKTAQESAAEAKRQESAAREAQGKAEEARRDAEEAQGEAEQARDEAEIAQQQAEASEREAVTQRDEAVRQRLAAQARQLAARAQFLQGDPSLGQKAALLAAESLRRLPSFEADQVLRTTLGLLPERITTFRHGGLIEPHAIASRGNFLAVGDYDHVLRVFDLQAMREVRSFQLDSRIGQVAISRSGEVFAAWVERNAAGGDVKVWDTRADREVSFDCRARRMAFSEDDSRLAVACVKGVLVVDTKTWAPRQLDIKGEVVAVAWSPNGRWIAALDDKADIQVWDREGQPVATITGQDPQAPVWSSCCQGFIAFSPNSEYLVSTNMMENGLRVLKTEDWQTYAVLPHEAPIHVFSFSDSPFDHGDLLATGSRNGILRVWDLRSRELVSSMSHGAEIINIELLGKEETSYGPVVVSASIDRTARVWDALKGTELVRTSHVGPVLWARLVGNRLATAEQQSSLSFWKRNVRRVPFRVATRHGEPTRAVCADAGQKVLALALDDGAVSLTLDGVERKRFFFTADNSAGPTFSPQCRWIALGNREGLEVHDVISGELVHKEEGYFAKTTLVFSPSRRYLAINREYEASELRETGSWKRIALPADCKATELAFSPDERYAGFRCGEAYVLKDLAPRNEAVRRIVERGALRFTPGGRVLLELAKGRISTLSLPKLTPIASVALPQDLRTQEAVPSPDGRTLAVFGERRVTLRRLPGLQRIVTHELPRNVSLNRVAWSPDGRELVALAAGRLLVFRVEPWELREELAHEGSIEAVTFDRENRWLAAIVRQDPEEREAQYSIRVWEIASGNEVARVPMERRAENVLFSPDRRYLIADQVYLFDTASLIAEACSRLTRNLTQREWDREIGESTYSPTCAGLGLPARATPDWEQ